MMKESFAIYISNCVLISMTTDNLASFSYSRQPQIIPYIYILYIYIYATVGKF